MEFHTELISFNATLIMQLINTLLICFLLTKFLAKPVHAFIEKRQGDIAEAINTAERKNDEAIALRVEYETRLENVKREGREVLVTAKTNAEERSREIIKHTYEQVDAIKKQAEIDINKERLKTVNEAREEIIEMAMLIAEKIIEKKLNEQEQHELIHKIMEEVGKQDV